MEAGNRCFDQRVPEEINRKIVDHISDINLPYSTISREYLLREGLAPDRVIKTGSPMYEVLHYYLPKIEASDVLARLQLVDAGVFRGERAPRGEYRRPGAVRQTGAGAELPGRDVSSNVSSSPPTRARANASRRKACNSIRWWSCMKPLGLLRLRPPADCMPAPCSPTAARSPRRVLDPQLPRAQYPQCARATGRDGRRRGDDDRIWNGRRSNRTGHTARASRAAPSACCVK